MSTGIFSIGNSALSAAYTALRTAGNNVANANTPGYSRETVILSPRVGTSISGNYVGQGVEVADVRRVYSDFLTQQAHMAQAASSGADARSEQLSQVSNMFASTTTGIGVSLDSFFASVQSLTQQPADAATRQAVLSSGQQLAARFTDVGNQLQQTRAGVDQQLQLEMGSVNRLADQIAQLNDKIALAQGSGVAPNDLLDQRDAAIRQMNQSIHVSVVVQSDGSANLFLGNGQPLVVGNTSSHLGMAADPFNPSDVRIGVKSGSNLIALDPKTVGGGKIGGLLTFRSVDLPHLENELGRLAVAVTDQFNTQHKLGNDRNGQPGTDFFTPLAPTAFGASTNGAAATISASFVDTTQLQASDYRIDYATAGGGIYTLTRLSDGTKWTSATPTFTQDGLSITLANTPPANGDKFLIQPVRNAALQVDVALSLPSQIAASNPVQATIPLTNIGSISVNDLSVVGPVRNPNLAQPVLITFTNPTTYTYSINGGAASAAQSFTSGQPIQIDGWSLTLLGVPTANDAVAIGPSIGAIADNRNALKLSQLTNVPAIDGAALSSAFSAIVARVGGDTQGANVNSQAQQSILTDALNAESSVSGVNLDEEASKLMQYQQQYQAAAKLIATADTIFQSILNLRQ